MSKVVRYEFFGSWIVFWFMFVTGVGIPVAVLYLLTRTLSVETEMKDPERFVADFRAGKIRPR